MYTAAEAFNSGEFTCKGVADRSGSGDCFMAGLTYGMYNRRAPQELLNYASAAAFGKLQEMGDPWKRKFRHLNNAFVIVRRKELR